MKKTFATEVTEEHRNSQRKLRGDSRHFGVDVNCQCRLILFKEDLIRRRLIEVLKGEGARGSDISVSIISDQIMQELNVRYLAHDYPTDVLSFRLDDGGADLSNVEGEIIVSAEMAWQRAGEFGWSAENELMYYLLHGMLHICGYDDHSPSDVFQMRQREAHYLEIWKLGMPTSERAV